eukprot:8130508-Pyramimonas_sp.AAC.1
MSTPMTCGIAGAYNTCTAQSACTEKRGTKHKATRYAQNGPYWTDRCASGTALRRNALKTR